MTVDELMKSWGTFLTLYTNNSTFRHNMEVLASVPLDQLGQDIACDAVKNVADLYSRGELGVGVWQPHILDAEETLDYLLAPPVQRSFCRIGDGEIQIMKGLSIPFQEYDSTLAEKMLEILRSSRSDCLVGIPHGYYTYPTGCTDYVLDWNLKNRMRSVKFLADNLNKERHYIATYFTVAYMVSKDASILQNHYDEILKLFEGKKMVVFAGANILAGLKHDVFAGAKSVEIVQCPKINAFSAYSLILDKARSYPKDEVILGFILGPTATVAAWDLSAEGYTAWDLGHVAKDYDAYCRQVNRSPEETTKFFAPD